MIIDILPCPFCNSKHLRVVEFPLLNNDCTDCTTICSHVRCIDCGADGPRIAFVEDVIKAWNDRK